MGKRKRSQKRSHHDPHQQRIIDEARLHPNAQVAKGGIVIPQKKLYRQRPHVNVFSDHNLVYPPSPAQMDWHFHFPNRIPVEGSGDASVEFADVGCGFGGLLFYLAPHFPDKLMVGMEIRVSVTQYVYDKVQALRAASRVGRSVVVKEEESSMTEEDADGVTTSAPAAEASSETRPEQESAGEDETEAQINLSLVKEAPRVRGNYDNISALRVNAMKFLPNFFNKGQLTKLFFLHPDPHFKQRKNKNRIISPTLLAEYAYILRPGGILYTITDVHDLHLWMAKHLDAFPLFQRLTEADLEGDVCVDAVWNATEEGKKVIRNKGDKWFVAYRRISDEEGEDSII